MQVFVKRCVLNYHAISDPFDADNNQLTTAAFSQWTSEQLVILDDWCLLAGTDTNFPSTNQFGLTPSETPDFTKVAEFFDRAVKITVDAKAAVGPKIKDFRAHFAKGAAAEPALVQLKDDVTAFAQQFPTVGFEEDTMRYPEEITA